ncbi:hypothetical protein J7384_15795 [Endozoicomonas sp. G2_1]|uniref:hypothetical protein n=1 Tax=Endozoicomonas sp. G2_1 TaxID=2821091 RepID=UPI001ADA75A0|nr:hypothetical protein [Endozoicomonas sp. G2_1]MBO9491823.1 hypothetical protein [Endozoicomonas sp. G2_1]
MSKFEVISTLVSILAIIISSVSLVRTRKLAKEQLDLEKITAKLSQLQIENLAEEKANKKKPNFNVTLSKLGKSYYFYISNTGQGSAYNLKFELVDCDDSPLISSELEDKFPHPEMKNNSRIKLNAAIHLSSPRKYQVKLSWEDSNQIACDEVFWVSY